MKTTAAVLKSLQDYYASLEIRPSIKECAQATNMPIATAARYLNGTNQTGDLERVRALCLALDRQDLLDELPSKQTLSSFQEAMALILEVKKESRESNLEELERVRKLHEESEKRLMDELDRAIKSRDHAINAYTNRIRELESDKTIALRDKERIYGEMAEVRRTKRKRDALLIAALIVIGLLLAAVVAYLFRFDVPNPGYGIFS